MCPSIGPHENRELELMKVGSKPLSMFTEPIPHEFECFPEEEFDQLVAEGKLIKYVSLEAHKVRDQVDVKMRRVLYALPAEEWRIRAILLVHEIYLSLGGWRCDLDRVIGALLGYDHQDVEHFVKEKDSRS